MALGDLVAHLSLNTAKFSSGIKIAQGLMKTVSSSSATLIRATGSSTSQVLNSVAGAAAKSTQAFGHFVKSSLGGIGQIMVARAKMNLEAKKGELIEARLAKLMQQGQKGGGVGMLGQIGLMSMGVQALSTGIQALTWPVQLAADAEQTKIAFTTFLGSAQKADDLLRDLAGFAAATPFEMPELKDSAQKLLAFGVSADQILPVMRSLGDLAAGTGQPVSELADLYGKMGVQGRLQMEDINQLTGRGIPIIQELAKQFGVSESEVRTLVETGQVAFPNLQQALVDLTGQGGKFGGLMEAQSQSLSGRWSTLKDTIGQGALQIGQALAEGFDMTAIIEQITNMTNQFVTNWMPAIVSTLKWLGEGFVAVFDTLSFAIGNADLLWAIAVENVKLFATNSWEYVKTFFTNIGEIAIWFGDNWSDILFTAVDYTLTLFINLGKNIRAIWAEVIEYISTMGASGFDVDFTPLLEGARSSISKMPELTEAAVREMTPELERLYGELGQREADARAKAAADAAAGATKVADLAITPVAGAAGKAASGSTKTADTKTAAGLALRGSREAYQSIIAAMDKNSPQLRVTKQQLAEQKKTTELLQKINKGFDSNKLGTATIS